MAKRPALSEESFLAHLFSPKKNALPTGLRARPVVVSKGRSKARVNAYNKMPAVKQEVLKRAGLRDAYLKGETTFLDAKKALRPKAVEKGIVRPVRTKKQVVTGPRRNSRATAGSIARNAMIQLARAEREFQAPTIIAGATFVQEDDADKLTYDQIKERARSSDYEIIVDGQTFNPYWYR